MLKLAFRFHAINAIVVIFTIPWFYRDKEMTAYTFWAGIIINLTTFLLESVIIYAFKPRKLLSLLDLLGNTGKFVVLYLLIVISYNMSIFIFSFVSPSLNLVLYTLRGKYDEAFWGNFIFHLIVLIELIIFISVYNKAK